MKTQHVRVEERCQRTVIGIVHDIDRVTAESIAKKIRARIQCCRSNCRGHHTASVH